MHTLSKMSGVSTEIDWDKLKTTIHTAVLFLNRVLDASVMPIPECQVAMELTRKIGLGIMGLHDMLIQLGIPYDSQEARDVAEVVMKFIAKEANAESFQIGSDDGMFKGAKLGQYPMRRNANLTTIAPTGTLSMIADCSSGCEPYYSAVTYKTVLDGTEFPMYNKWVEVFAKRDNITNEEALIKYAELFKGANEIHWSAHVKMQAVLQRHVDSSISKTINMPNDATVQDVRDAYELAYELGCKGITVYRDGSRETQVLSSTAAKESGERSVQQMGCTKAELPDTLSATRYRIKVDGLKVYIIICEDADGNPVEIFTKWPYQRDSSWDAVCRSLSLSLRYGIPLSEVVKQMEKSIKAINDMPSQLARILKTYQSEKGVDVVGYQCPECGGKIIYTEGCEKCLDNCGWSKCG